MKKTVALVIYTLIIVGLITFCWLAPFSLLWQIIFTACLSFTLVGFYLALLKFKKIYKALIAILILEVLIMGIYTALYYSGLLVHFESIESTRDWFASFGAWAWTIFFLIQLAQVIVLPIPAQLTTIAGTLIFGGWIAFLISTLAVIMGSIIAFWLGRWLGVDIAIKISSKETTEKYRDMLTKKGILFLPIMFLFPLFPDDLLCFIAGTTKISWTYFIIVTLLTRPLGIGLICFFGSGDIIPFSGWGIPVWIVLIILLVTTAIILLKYQDKIINWTVEKFGKKTKFDKYKDSKKYRTDEAENFETSAEINIQKHEKNLDKEINKK